MPSDDLDSVRRLVGRHGTWLDNGSQAILVPTEDASGTPSAQLLTELNDAGLFAEDMSSYAVTVVTTTRCNLTCDYCYQAETAGPDPVRIPAVSLATGDIDALTSFVATQMRMHAKDTVDLLLTGGEPLLSYRRCLETLHAFSDLGLSAAQMFTNGSLLTAHRGRELQTAGLTRVQVPLDGFATEHDRYRRDVSGAGSFDRILRNLQALVEEVPEMDLVVRINVSATNTNSIRQLLHTLLDRLGTGAIELRFGLLDDIGIGFDAAPAWNHTTAESLADTMMLAVDLGFFVAPLASVASCRYCSVPAGGSGCVINADGTLYSCWESVGREGYEVGTVVGGYVDQQHMKGRWVDCSFNVAHDAGLDGWLSDMNDRIDGQVLDRMYERSKAETGTR